ncbi:FecR family protein [Joostella sp. CR20]|uniref:FecR family protein n=1 Tax=Joostella sp. CR20 TaxID=2804312 RepID=UPI00313B3221
MNKNQLSKNAVVRLIVKSILGNLTSEEKETFSEWLNNGNNNKLYKKIINPSNLDAKEKLYKSINKEAAYNRVLKTIAANKQQRKKKALFQVYKYAAVIIVALLAGTFVFKNYKSEEVITEENLVKITPGYHKATLILGNGEVVDLTAHQNETINATSAKISNKNNTLDYTATTSESSAEISYNTLIVPTGGIYNIVLPDGSKVWLNSNSTLTYPEIFTEDTRTVKLEGEAYFDVVKNKGKFVVKTQHQNVTVLGTSFNVSAYKQDNYFSSTLVEGKIELSSEETEAVILTPGTRGYLKFDSNKKVFVSKVDVRNYSSWKDGIFYFDNEKLPVILKKIGRWYGFDVAFEDEKAIDNILFTGVFKKDAPIKDLLEMIRKTSGIAYQVEEINETYKIKISK